MEGLLFLKDICEKKDILYFLAYGADRRGESQRLIPWDDDIDILVPREDYERLRVILKNTAGREWELLSWKDNDRYLFYWMKLCNTQTVIEPSRLISGLQYGGLWIFSLWILLILKRWKDPGKKYLLLRKKTERSEQN